MTIAILAHDSRKELALQFCTAYSGILSRNTVIATGTTGRMLAQATRVLEEFRSGFVGKCSPVHFFWGSFDLALTRFSGRRAPPW